MASTATFILFALFAGASALGLRVDANQVTVADEKDTESTESTPDAAYTNVGKVSWQTASDKCAAEGKQLCKYSDYCPSGTEGSTPLRGLISGDVWAPIADTTNDWVQLGSQHHPPCKKHSAIIHNGQPQYPSWGTQGGCCSNNQILCCSSDQGAGSATWTLLVKSIAGDAGTPDLSSKADEMQESGEFLITWSISATPSDPNKEGDYEKAVTFTLPNKAAITGASRSAGGQQCSSSAYYTSVAVTCVRGECNMPSTMYTGTNFNRICYNRAYGLVSNTPNQGQCDWSMDGQAFRSLYLGNSGCHGSKDQSNTMVQNSAMKAIALWVKKAANVEYTPVQVVYSAGTTGPNPETVTGTLAVKKDATYSLTVEILRNDLGNAAEKVQSISLDGTDLGACNPDGGDYDCTFFTCPGLQETITATSDSIAVSMVFIGHSWDCDCDVQTWECSKENTVTGRTNMRAVARFTLTEQTSAPTPAPTSTNWAQLFGTTNVQGGTAGNGPWCPNTVTGFSFWGHIYADAGWTGEHSKEKCLELCAARSDCHFVEVSSHACYFWKDARITDIGAYPDGPYTKAGCTTGTQEIWYMREETTTTTTSDTAEYVEGASGTSNCPTGSVAIQSEQECFEAVPILRPDATSTTTYSGSWAHTPPGCFLQLMPAGHSQAGTVYPHWNTNAAGINTKNSYVPVCKKSQSCKTLSTFSENNFDDRGSSTLDPNTSYEYTLSCGFPVTLRGWTHTRIYAKGFLRNLDGKASAVVRGLTPGVSYEFSIFQYGEGGYKDLRNSYTVNGGPSEYCYNREQTTATVQGVALADAAGQITFEFNRESAHVHLSAIAMRQLDENLARACGVNQDEACTASATSRWTGSALNQPARVVNGILEENEASGGWGFIFTGNANQYLTINLGASKSIASVKIWFGNYRTQPGLRESDFEIWVGDSTSYNQNTRCYQHSGQAANEEEVACVAAGQYVHVFFPNVVDGGYASIREIEVHASDRGGESTTATTTTTTTTATCDSGYSDTPEEHCKGTSLNAMGTYPYQYVADQGSTLLDKTKCAEICDSFEECKGFLYRRASKDCLWKGGTLTPIAWPPAQKNGEYLDCVEKGLGNLYCQTPTPTPAPALSAAKGDPHLMNIKGEAFDVMQTGNMMLLEIPRGSSPATLDLALHADIERLGVVSCGPTFITSASITGRWIGVPMEIRSGHIAKEGRPQAKHTFAMRFDGKAWLPHAEMQGTTELSKDATLTARDRMFLVQVRGLDIAVSQPKRPRIFLDIQVKGLGNLKTEIGGLLGIDDHSSVEELPPGCEMSASSLSLFAMKEDEALQWSARALL